jgi:hypothetical protein
MQRIVCTAMIMVVLGAALFAAPYELPRSTIDGGGVIRSGGGDFERSGTIGQADPGASAGGVYALTGGFWFAVPPTDCNEDGAANLLDHASFTLCLAGPAGSAPPGCDCFDTDQSGSVDLRDVAAAQSVYSGP